MCPLANASILGADNLGTIYWHSPMGTQGIQEAKYLKCGDDANMHVEGECCSCEKAIDNSRQVQFYVQCLMSPHHIRCTCSSGLGLLLHAWSHPLHVMILHCCDSRDVDYKLGPNTDAECPGCAADGGQKLLRRLKRP